jgi:hypothetical protein
MAKKRKRKKPPEQLVLGRWELTEYDRELLRKGDFWIYDRPITIRDPTTNEPVRLYGNESLAVQMFARYPEHRKIVNADHNMYLSPLVWVAVVPDTEYTSKAQRLAYYEKQSKEELLESIRKGYDLGASDPCESFIYNDPTGTPYWIEGVAELSRDRTRFMYDAAIVSKQAQVMSKPAANLVFGLKGNCIVHKVVENVWGNLSSYRGLTDWDTLQLFRKGGFRAIQNASRIPSLEELYSHLVSHFDEYLDAQRKRREYHGSQIVGIHRLAWQIWRDGTVDFAFEFGMVPVGFKAFTTDELKANHGRKEKANEP